MTHVSVKTLRRYHGSGLLERAEVGKLLATGDPDQRSELIAAHLTRLETQLAQTQAAISSGRRLLDPQAAPIEVERRRMPATTIAAIRGTVARPDVLDWYSEAMTEIGTALTNAGQIPNGPPDGLYDNDLFTEECGDMAVFVPVAHPAAGGCSYSWSGRRTWP